MFTDPSQLSVNLNARTDLNPLFHLSMSLRTGDSNMNSKKWMTLKITSVVVQIRGRNEKKVKVTVFFFFFQHM